MRFSVAQRIVTAIAVGFAQPAPAQCLLCTGDARGPVDAIDRADAEAERPLRVEITADLDFARLVAGASGGNISLDPSTGHPSSTGDVRQVSGLGFTGRIHIEGSPGRMVRIDLPETAILTSANGGRVTVSNIGTGLAPLVRIGGDGRLDVTLGGQLHIIGAVDGEFRGRIPVTVSYE